MCAAPKQGQTIPAGVDVTVDVSTHYLDHAAQQAIDDWSRQHRATGGSVHLTRLQ